jgi:hypothetical protein
MDANLGEPWSEIDIADLAHSLAYGNTIADAARMLCRDDDEVRQKAEEGSWASRAPRQAKFRARRSLVQDGSSPLG